jgi:putative ABC transport system substrate-binding protein
MRRRDFLAWIAATSMQPSAVVAQGKLRRLAVVHSGVPADQLTESDGPFWVRRVYQTLRRLGEIEGENLVIERFSAEGRSERFAAVTAEVVNRNPDVIILNGPPLIKRFMAATSIIPLVAITSDPLAAGLITNVAHPGGNLTGVSINSGIEISGKRLQLLKEALPNTRTVAALLTGPLNSQQYGEAAVQLGVELMPKLLTEVNEIVLSAFFGEIAEQKFDAAIVDESGSFLAQRALITSLANKYRVPVLYPYRDYVEEGGLMAYAPDLGELAQRMASVVHEILNGTRPGDIPFYLPNKYQFIFNVKAANLLGLELPPSLLARADEVIE